MLLVGNARRAIFLAYILTAGPHLRMARAKRCIP